MFTSAIFRVLTATTSLGLLAGEEPGAAPTTQPANEVWPAQLAAHALRVVTEDYVIYGDSAPAAERVRRWMDQQLAHFRMRYDCGVKRPGLLFLIEPGPERIPAVEQWRKKNVKRARMIYWTSPIRTQSIRTRSGRPYTSLGHPYFVESFSMPPEACKQLGLLEGLNAAPPWICFLTTRGLVLARFEEELQQIMRRFWEELGRAVIEERTNDIVGACIFGPVALVVFPTYCSIDQQLMLLQRRETLWTALLECAETDAAHRAELLGVLRDEIDADWKYIWVRRPIE